MKTLWGFGEREFNYVYVYSPSTWKVHSLNQSGWPEMGGMTIMITHATQEEYP